jgi:hypothetical protein
MFKLFKAFGRLKVYASGGGKLETVLNNVVNGADNVVNSADNIVHTTYE